MLARAARCRVVVRLFVPGECVMLTRIAVDCSGAEHIQRSILKQVSVDRGRAAKRPNKSNCDALSNSISSPGGSVKTSKTEGL